METPTENALSIEEQAATAVRLGRELNQMASVIYAGGNTHDYTFVKRTLQRLGEREPFDPRDDASLDVLRAIVEKDLQSEIVGTERTFVETRYDEHGQHGEVRDAPIYTDRGRSLIQIVETLTCFIAARNATLDRVAAERSVLRLLRT